mgnify:FL=1
MNKSSKLTKDQYGNYVKEEEFKKYWDDYHRLEDLSMKESIRQKEERLKKLDIDL